MVSECVFCGVLSGGGERVVERGKKQERESYVKFRLNSTFCSSFPTSALPSLVSLV